jgi:hypothetical protein
MKEIMFVKWKRGFEIADVLQHDILFFVDQDMQETLTDFKVANDKFLDLKMDNEKIT